MNTRTFLKGLTAACLSILVLAFSCACANEKQEDTKSVSVSSRVASSPLMVLGTYDEQGRTNFALFDRGGIVETQPHAYICVSIRKYSYTHQNILALGAVTINLPSEAQIEEADLFGSFSALKDGLYRDKLASTGMTAVKGSYVDAPMLNEFPISMECELAESDSIVPGAPFTLFIFKIVAVWVEPGYLNSRGFVNPRPQSKPGLALYVPGRSDGSAGYYALGDFLGTVGEPGKKLRQTLRKKLAEENEPTSKN